MSEKTISQEELTAMTTIFAVWEQYLKGITPESFAKEKSYYLNQPITPPNKENIELIEIERNTAVLKEFYVSLNKIPDAIEIVKNSLATIGLEAKMIDSGIERSIEKCLT